MQQARSGLHLQILAAAYEMESLSYVMVLKNGGHTLKQQHSEQGTYAVEGGGVEVDKATQSVETMKVVLMAKSKA